MALWRVDVLGVSSRYVEAESRSEAVDAVRAALAAALDVRATRASPVVQSAFDNSGPVQRRRLLESLDSLAPPEARKRARTAKRQLARQVRYDLELREATKASVSSAPPVPPETADELIRLTEMARLRSPAIEKLLRGSD